MSRDRNRPKLPAKHPVGISPIFGERQVHMGIGRKSSTTASYQSHFDKVTRKFTRTLLGYFGGNYKKPHQGKKECARRRRQIEKGMIMTRHHSGAPL